MKKVFLLGAMAVAALASCSKDDVVDVNKGEGISFRASLDKALTRANVTKLENLAAFNVTAVGNVPTISQIWLSRLMTTVIHGKLLPPITGRVTSLPSSLIPPRLPPAL